jgi:hypothetical protein
MQMKIKSKENSWHQKSESERKNEKDNKVSMCNNE